MDRNPDDSDSTRATFPFALAVYGVLLAVVIVLLMWSTGRPFSVLVVAIAVLIPAALILLLAYHALQGHNSTPKFIADQILLGYGPAGVLTLATQFGFVILGTTFLYLLNFKFDEQFFRNLSRWAVLLFILIFCFLIYAVPRELAKLILSYRGLNQLNRRGAVMSCVAGALGIVCLDQTIFTSTTVFYNPENYSVSFWQKTGRILLSLVYQFPMQTGTGVLLGAAVGRGAEEVQRAYVIAVAFQGSFAFFPVLPNILLRKSMAPNAQFSIVEFLLTQAIQIVILATLIFLCKRVRDKVVEEDGFVPLPVDTEQA